MKKYSITIAGHRTSVSLEEPFWIGLEDAANAHETSRIALITKIDNNRGPGGLSSALRLHVLDFYKTMRKPLRTDQQ